jgi:hypothetical protein
LFEANAVLPRRLAVPTACDKPNPPPVETILQQYELIRAQWLSAEQNNVKVGMPTVLAHRNIVRPDPMSEAEGSLVVLPGAARHHACERGPDSFQQGAQIIPEVMRHGQGQEHD